MDSITPYVVVAVLCFLASAVVLFAYLRTRVGDWLALAGAVWILFLGSAHEDLLIPFSDLVLRPRRLRSRGAAGARARRPARTDALACGAADLLGLTFNGLGLAFLVACAIVLGVRPSAARPPLWVIAVPAALYCPLVSDLRPRRTRRRIPSCRGTSRSRRFSSSTALRRRCRPCSASRHPPRRDDVDASRLGPAAAGPARLPRSQRSRSPLPAPPADAGALRRSRGRAHLLAADRGPNADEFRQPTFSRYMYPGAIFVLMIAAELLAWRAPADTGAVVAVFAVIAVALVEQLGGAASRAYNTPTCRRPQVIRGRPRRRWTSPPTTSRPGDWSSTRSNSDFAYYGLIDAGSLPGGLAPSTDRSATRRRSSSRPRSAAAWPPTRCWRPRLASASRPGLGGHRPAAGASISAPTGGATWSWGRAARWSLLRRGPTPSSPCAALRPPRFRSAPAEWGRDRTSISIPSDSASDPWELRLSGRGRLSVCAPRN